jgi:YidC/Oxa1 family membrane protein insertase
VVLTASSVRFGSWYAPWSSGKASSPAGDTLSGAEQVPVAEYTAPASHHVEPVVTSTASEVASAHIEKAPVVDTTTAAAADSAADSASSYDTSSAIYDLLETADPVKRDIDPTALIEHGGQLKELGLDYGWGMTTIFERTIEQIYLQSGMGWAGSIMVAGVVVRCATFFLQAMSSDKMAAMASMKPLTAPIQEKLDAAIARGDKQQEQVLKMQQAQILAPYMGGIFSMGGFMLAQAWIGFSAFRCLRAMSSLPVPGMANDGYLWFTDLTVRDPYCVLPVVTTALFYTIFKVIFASTGFSFFY